jgi:hypothetical protein
LRSRQAVVVETSKNGITVLTSDGQFLFIPIKNSVYMVGEQINLPDMSGFSAVRRCTGKRSFSQFLRRRLLPIAAVASLLLCTSFFGYTKYLEARPSLAWVTIDLVDSPGSMELEVNDKGLIKSAAYFDEETERLASSLNLYMKPVNYAVEVLLKDKQRCGQPEVVIGIIPVEEDPAKENPVLDRLEAKILKDVQKAAEKAAKQVAKAAQKGAKEAAKGSPEHPGKESVKPAERPSKQTEDPRQSGSKGPGNSQTFASVSVSRIRLDRQARDVAKELQISAARAVLWALSHRFRDEQMEHEQGTREMAGIDRGYEYAVQGGKDAGNPEGAMGLTQESPDSVEVSRSQDKRGTGKPNDSRSDNGKTDSRQARGQDEKQPSRQQQDQANESKKPPGQAKKQPDFKLSIPKAGIERIKGQGPEIDPHYLSELAKEWAQKVKEAQKSKTQSNQGKPEGSGKPDGKSPNDGSDNNPGKDKAHKHTGKSSSDKAGNAGNNKQTGNNHPTDKSWNPKSTNNKSTGGQAGKSPEDKSSKSKNSSPAGKPNIPNWTKFTPWGK